VSKKHREIKKAVIYNKARDEKIGTAKTFGATRGEEVTTKNDGIPGPRGRGGAIRQIIYFYKRDIQLLKKYQEILKKEHGKVTISEIIRWAINTINIKHFHRGF